MRVRRVEIERVVVDGATTSATPWDGERFRTLLAEELVRILGENHEVSSVVSRERLTIDAERARIPNERADARIVARSVARTITGC